MIYHSRPTKPVIGDIWYDIVSDCFKLYDAHDWVEMSDGPVDSKNITDEFLIFTYPWLADLNPKSLEYQIDIDKLRTFEILKQE